MKPSVEVAQAGAMGGFSCADALRAPRPGQGHDEGA